MQSLKNIFKRYNALIARFMCESFSSVMSLVPHFPDSVSGFSNSPPGFLWRLQYLRLMGLGRNEAGLLARMQSLAIHADCQSHVNFL